MRTAVLSSLFITLMFFLFQTGCEKKTVTPKQTHWDAVKAIISENPDLFRLGFYDNDSDTLFYREILENDPDIEEGILVEEDTATSGPDPFFPYISLTWGDSLYGKFHYRREGKWYQKSINSIALTKALFERWGDSGDPYLGWILQRFSGTVISSNKTTVHPSILYILSDGVDEIITEPRLTGLVKKDSTLEFGKSQLVTFTIEPIDTTDFCFLYVKENSVYQKIPFVNNGDETLSASWTTTGSPDPDKRYYHAIVDIVSRESVTDTLAGYDCKAWGIIYRIE
jgi:hypothetical protein